MTMEYVNMKAAGITPAVVKAYQAGKFDLLSEEHQTWLTKHSTASLSDYLDEYHGL